MMRPLVFTAAVVGLFSVWAAGAASAGVCDLTTDGATCGPAVFTNFGIFGEVSPQPTGTGYIDPFLRLLAKDHEEGVDTSARPFQQPQPKPLNYTRDLLRSQGRPNTIGNVEYREFFLDINESKNQGLLSLDRLRIYLSPTGERDSYDSMANKLDGLAAIYDLDAGGDNWIKLDYSFNHGSGPGDIVAYIPNSLFTGAGAEYVYLNSRFVDQPGHEPASDTGLEEWWDGPASGTPRDVTAVPEPATLVLLGTGLTWAVRRRRKTTI